MNDFHPIHSAREHGIMQGFPPPPDRRISLATWDHYPFNRWSFQNVRSVLPTRAVRHDPRTVRHLARADTDLGGLITAMPGGGLRAFSSSGLATRADIWTKSSAASAAEVWLQAPANEFPAAFNPCSAVKSASVSAGCNPADGSSST